MSAGSPWAWNAHPYAWVMVAVLAVGYAVALTRLGPLHAPPRPVCHRSQLVSFAAGLAVLAVATMWPVSDLGRHWSLLAHMFDLTLLVLAVPPLLLLGLPRWLVGLATAPPAVDGALRRLTRPVTATIIYNSAVVGSLLPPVISASHHEPPAAAAVQIVLLLAGVVMWTPVLHMLPGPDPMSTGARVAYLFVQSVVPNFPALIYIFASAPIYPAFAHGAPVLGLSGMADQQLAGALAKLLGIGVLWGVAAIFLVRAQHAEEQGRDPNPLVWDDVEAELHRLERRTKRTDAGGHG